MVDSFFGRVFIQIVQFIKELVYKSGKNLFIMPLVLKINSVFSVSFFSKKVSSSVSSNKVRKGFVKSNVIFNPKGIVENFVDYSICK